MVELTDIRDDVVQQETIAEFPGGRHDMEAAFARAFEPRRQDAYVVAVLPAHNEDRFIGSMVLKARLYADLVLVIDDGSSDQTAIVAREAGAETIRHTTNRGKASALRTGFARATELCADVVVMLDGDGQHDPAYIPALIHPILCDEADMVIGSRFKGVKNEIPAWRQAGQHTLTLITNLASGVPSSDSQSGFRAFSRRALETLHIRSKGFAVESELQFWAREQGLRVQEVSISCIYEEKAKRSPFRQGLQVIDGILGLVSKTRPLLFFGVSGFLAAVAGILAWGWILHTYNHTGELALGYALLATLLVIIGTLACFEGITLHILRGMMLHLGRRETKMRETEESEPTATKR